MTQDRKTSRTTSSETDIVKINVLGLEYVGAVSLAGLARDGQEIIGVDIDQMKLDLIASDKSPIVEEGIVELLEEVAKSGRVEVTTDTTDAIARTEISFVCVGPPPRSNGDQDQTASLRPAEQLGDALKSKGETHIVVVRSIAKPGFAFGGSCLPKDLKFLLYIAKTNDIKVPMSSGMWPSNQIHIDQAASAIFERGVREASVIGLSFKSGEDDLRESPLVTLVEKLIGKDVKLKIYDSEVRISASIGANKRYISEVVPHIGELMCDSVQEAMNGAAAVVVGLAGKTTEEAVDSHGTKDRFVVDLVGLARPERIAGYCKGICW